MSYKEIKKNKVFLRTFGWPYEALLQTDFTVFGRVI